jgi:hypothetical protein
MPSSADRRIAQHLEQHDRRDDPLLEAIGQIVAEERRARHQEVEAAIAESNSQSAWSNGSARSTGVIKVSMPDLS